MSENDEQKKSELFLQSQIVIAMNMALKEKDINFLKTIPLDGWREREWYYICLLDRMPLVQLEQMRDKKYSVSRIIKERVDFWKNKTKDLEPLNHTVEKLEEEVRSVLVENKQAQETFFDQIQPLMEKQVAAQEQALKAKDEQIKMLKDRVTELLKKEDEEKPNEISGLNPSSQDTLPEPLQDINRERGGILTRFRRNRSTDKITLLLKDENLSDEQKDFLLQCLEEGMEISKIEKLAIPGQSITNMQRMKKIIQNNK